MLQESAHMLFQVKGCLENPKSTSPNSLRKVGNPLELIEAKFLPLFLKSSDDAVKISYNQTRAIKSSTNIRKITKENSFSRRIRGTINNSKFPSLRRVFGNNKCIKILLYFL